MTKSHHQNKRWNSYLALMALGLVLVIVDACRKIDYNRDKRQEVNYSDQFFRVPVNADPIVKRLAAMMEIANKKNNFANAITKEVGRPIWNKTVGVFKRTGTGKNNDGGGGGGEDTLVFVPIAGTEEDALIGGREDQVKGFFAAIVREDSINIRLFKGKNYKKYGRTNKVDTMSAETVAITSMFLEARAFSGHDTFDITDKALFYDVTNPDSTTRYVIVDTTMIPWEDPGGGARSSTMVSVLTQFCYNYQAPQEGAGRNSSLSSQPVCVNLYHWAQYVDDGGIGLLTINVPGGGGGVTSGGNLNYDPNCNQFPGGVCGTPFLGWTRKRLTYNPYAADTVGYTNALKIGYPCVYSFIKDSLLADMNLTANILAQLAGGRVFKDSTRMHLTFDTSTTLTQANQATAETINGAASVDYDGTTSFFAHIQFNGWHLRNGTKEHMVSTIVHELMHAVFRLRWGQYQQWLLWGPPNPIDSGFMKLHYPIFWQNYVINGIPPGGNNDHQIMATDYFEMFKGIVSQFWNPAATPAERDSVCKALCYGGLNKTTAWKLLASQGIDTCRYKAIMITAERSLIGTYTNGSCPNFTTHYADSLKMRAHCN